MITVEPPFYTVRGATVFRDHADPRQFWVLPGPPALVTQPGADGTARAGFTLYTYRRDLTDNPLLEPTRAKGGGLAFLDVEAGPPPLGTLQAEVASLAGQPDAVVSPVLFRSGTVRAIVARAGDDRLIEDLVETSTASPVTPHRATFALALTPEGASLMDQAARGGALPVGVAYELRFLALTPALHARVRMDYERIYDHFSASVGLTYYYVQAKFDLDLAWLVEHDLITVEITSFTDGADQQRQRDAVMALVAARIQQDFFRTGIPPEPQPGAGDALGALLAGLLGGKEVTSSSALFVLKAKVEAVREAKQFELRYDGRTAVELTHVSTGLLSTLVAGGAPPVIEQLDLDADFFATLNVTVVGGVDPEDMPDLTGVVATLVKGDHRASYEFTAGGPDRYRFEVPLTDPRDDAYEVSYTLSFDSGGATTVTAGPFRTRERALVVNPAALVDYRRLRLLLGAVDPSVVPRIRVTVRLLAEADETELSRDEFTLDAAAPEAVWHRHLPLGTRVRTLVGAAWEDAHGTPHPGPWTAVPDGTATYLARGPFVDELVVTAVPGVDWASGATHAEAEIAYADGDYVVHRTLTFLAAAGTAGQTVEIPLLDATRRTYRWRQVVYGPAAPVATPWADADQRILVIGAAPRTTDQVRLVWVGDPAGAFGLRVDLAADTAAGRQQVSTFLRTGVDLDRSVTVPLDAAGRLAYHFEVRRIGLDGETLVQSGEAQTSLLIVRAA